MSEEFFKTLRRADSNAALDMLKRDSSLARAVDDSGVSALMVALYHGLSDLSASIAQAKGELDLFESAAVGKADDVSRVLKSAPEAHGSRSADGFTPLHLAAFFSRTDVVRLLLEYGADPQPAAANPSQVRPLHSAAAGRDASKRFEITQALLQAGADADSRQAGGFTALHSASMHGDIALAELLLNSGAGIDLGAEDGRTALDFAMEKEEQEMADFLRRRGASTGSQP